MKYIYDFVAGKVPFEEFWPEFCRNKEMQDWLDAAGNFEAEEPPGIKKTSFQMGEYRNIRKLYNGHVMKELLCYMPNKIHYRAEEKWYIFLGFEATLMSIDPKVVRTKIYKQDADFYEKAVGYSVDGPEVWNFIDSVLEQFPRTMKAAERVKAGRAALHEAFHIQGRKFPSWPQEADWPMGKNSPMEYLGRRKDGDLVQLRFRDVDTGEERVIEQFY